MSAVPADGAHEEPSHEARTTVLPSPSMTAQHSRSSSSARYTSTIPSNTNTHTMTAEPNTNGDLPRLQAKEQHDFTLLSSDDPKSFELLQPSQAFTQAYSLEKASLSLFSREHLQIIFADPTFLLHFTTFLGVHRPSSVPLLVHYLDTLKSLRAIAYANAILEGLDPIDGLEWTQDAVTATVNAALETRAQAAFNILVREELPAYVCYQWIGVVSESIAARITGSLAPGLREASEGLAEVFCLTDPSRADNPIVFASEGRTLSLSTSRG
jgi:hypothetical protein